MAEKKDNFERLAEERVSKALKSLILIGNLANQRNYSYTKKQAKEVLDALKAGVDDVERKFSSEGTDTKLFTFKS